MRASFLSRSPIASLTLSLWAMLILGIACSSDPNSLGGLDPSQLSSNGNLNETFSDGLGDLDPDPNDGLGDLDPDPYAPALNSTKVVAQMTDQSQSRAMVLGLPGAADIAKGVDEVCAQNLTSPGDSVCGSVSETGSFRLVLNGSAGDTVSAWTNGPGYASGGPGRNDIEKIVQHFGSQFGASPQVFEEGFLLNENGHPVEGIFVGDKSSGVYFYAMEDLLQAKPDIRAIHFTEADGLPSNHVSSLHFDPSKATLWIGTRPSYFRDQQIAAGGLAKASLGNGFTLSVQSYCKEARCDSYLDSNSISGIAVDQSGQVWIGTDDSGIQMLNVESGCSEQSVKAQVATAVASTSVSEIVFDGVGFVWAIDGNGKDLHRLTNLSCAVTSKEYDSENSSLPSGTIRTIFADSNGDLWIGISNNVYRYNRSTGAISFSSILNVPSNVSFQFGEDSLGRVYVIRNGFLSLFSKAESLDAHLPAALSFAPDLMAVLKNDKILVSADGKYKIISLLIKEIYQAVVVDDEILIGQPEPEITELVYRPIIKEIQDVESSEGLPRNTITAVSPGIDPHSAWVGTDIGLSYVKIANDGNVNVKRIPELADTWVNGLVAVGHHLWISNANGPIKIDLDQNLNVSGTVNYASIWKDAKIGKAFVVARGEADTVWFEKNGFIGQLDSEGNLLDMLCVNGGLVPVIDPSVLDLPTCQHLSIPFNAVTGLTWAQNSLWIAGNSGVYRHDKEGGGAFYNLGVSTVEAIASSSEGLVWIGGDGQLFYKSDGQQFTPFPNPDVVFGGHSIQDIAPISGTACAWVATSGGLLRACTDGSVKSFSTTDGLPSNFVSSVLSLDQSTVLSGSVSSGAVFFTP